MPRGPANLNGWVRNVDLFWRLPVYPALMVKLAFHAIRETLFRRCSRHYELYHEAGFFPFAVPPNLKTVFTIHDLLSLICFPEHHPRERVLYTRLFFRRRCKTVDHFLAVSEFTAKEMQSYLGIDPKKTTITLEGYDNKIFSPRRDREIGPLFRRHSLPKKYFLFVGGGDPRKNLNVVPEALEKAGLKIPLVVVGWSGWSDEKSWKNVIPVGYVSDDDLVGLYSGATALIFPSSHEGFGLPIVEAMACGCPVVTTRESSLPEVAGEGAIFMRGPRDVYDLAGILRRLAGDPSLRQRIRDEGQVRARRFSWEETARKTFDTFEMVLK